MKLHLQPNEVLVYGSVLLCALGLFFLALALGRGDTFVTAYWQRYTSYLEKTMRLLFMDGSATKIVRVQLGALAATLVIEFVLFDIPYWYALVALIVFGPVLHLANERKKRVALLEKQVDGFILALANSLKTVAGPASALQAIIPILQNPTRQEIERVVKELRVGNTLEQSIVNMSARIGSRTMDSALSSVLIGLQVGGNLPFVLENTAATIREMNRLDGVVRTKTAEGKAQLWVLAVFPFGICFGFNAVQPGYFDPLQTTIVGYIIISIATFLWIASMLVARKVLKVDI
jgi:tight adherence protein B